MENSLFSKSLPLYNQLWNAIANNQVDLVKYLVHLTPIKRGHTYIAISRNRAKILTYIASTGYVPTGYDLETAITFENVDIVNYLLSLGVHKRSNIKKLFNIAIEAQSKKMIALFIHHGMTMQYLIDEMDLNQIP